MFSSVFSVVTDNPVALDSVDHTHPLGTMQDNYSNPAFNQKLYQIVDRSELMVLDIGCAGGGFVKSLNDDGVPAIGIEGSDYSLIHNRAEWATIPDKLFTADAAKWFRVFMDGVPASFPVVTAWEFMEHIPEEDLPVVSENVMWHLARGGLFIASITTVSSPNYDGTEMHAIIQPEDWWTKKLWDLGWVRQPDLERHFGGDIVRNGPGSFFAVMKAAQ